MHNYFEDYISVFPDNVKILLIQIRQAIKEIAPESIEGLSYGMPSFKTNGKPLVYFAAFKNHIGFYATPSGHLHFAKELSKYKQGKGSVQFPIDNAMPIDLIKRIVKFRVQENKLKEK